MKLKIYFLVICGLTLATYAGEISRYEKIETQNNFVIILDKSGSMANRPIREAKKAIHSFLSEIENTDRAAFITFSSKVTKIFGLTSTPYHKIKKINKIQTQGSTALYDAIAMGFDHLQGLPGTKIIVYLTDGRDNSSHFSIDNIRSMTKSENIFVYGIGLGDVAQNKLKQLSQVTGGEFLQTPDPSEIDRLYSHVLDLYYQKYGNLQSRGSLIVKSIPGNLDVYISGDKVGTTPKSISNLKSGTYKVKIDYAQGSWKCNTKIKSGYRTIIDARKSEVSHNLIIGSEPGNSSVFLDGTYVGQTSMVPIKKKNKFWGGKKNLNLDRQLVIKGISKGEHTLKLLAMPDSKIDMGNSLKYRFKFKMKKNIAVDVKVIDKKADFIGQTDKNQDAEQQIEKGFEDLEQETK